MSKLQKLILVTFQKKKKRVGKYVGWKPHYKKAIVTLANGNTINLFTEN